jgi:hypothetical protein
MKAILPLLILVLVAPSAADACNRCGRFGGSCRYFRAPYVAPYRAKAVVKVVQAPDVYVVQNNFPTPLVAQGNTLYQSTGSYQAALLPFLDPNRYFEQELQLLRAVDQTNSIRSQRASVLIERIVELQAPAVERLAAGQAAQLVLQAAGLDPAHNVGGPTQQAVIINRDAAGRLQVLPLNAEQYRRLESSTTTITEEIGTVDVDRVPDPVAAKYPLLTQHCGGCHKDGGPAEESRYRTANLDTYGVEEFKEMLRRISLPVDDSEHMPRKIELDFQSFTGIVAELSQ